MTTQDMIKLIMTRYNVSWEVAYNAVRENDGDYMMACGYIRDMLGN